MSISLSKLNYLKDTKTHLKNAIVDAGVEVLDSDPFASYIDKIVSIEVPEAPVDDGVIKITSYDISEFDTIYSRIEEVFGENMQGVFLNIFAKNLDWSVFNTLKNTDFTAFFALFYGLHLDVANLDTSYATSLRSMFSTSILLENLDLSNFNTSNVTDMSSMFNGCSNLTTLDLSSFDTSNVTNMSSMFSSCDGLTTLDLSSFDTSNVTNMSSMFSSCGNLTTLDFLSNLDTSNVTDMSSMFRNCDNLTIVDLSSFDTSNVTDMSDMFMVCGNLTTVNLSSFDTSNVTNMSDMFRYCSGLTTILFGNNWAANSEITSLGMQYNPLSKESILDLANKIADKNSLSSAATVTLKSSQQSLFTEDELSSLTTTFSNKNWTLTWS